MEFLIIRGEQADHSQVSVSEPDSLPESQEAPGSIQTRYDRWVFILENTYDATAHEASSVASALSILSQHAVKIDLIIAINPTATQQELQNIQKSFSSDLVIPMIVAVSPCLLKTLTASTGFIPVQLTQTPDTIIQAIDELGTKQSLNIIHSSEPHCRIRTRLLLSVSPLKGDIFIRLSKDKFIKLFHQGATFDLEDLEKYTVKKNVHYLYIQRSQCKELAVKLTDQIKSDLKKPLAPVQKAAARAGAIHQTIQELVKSIGFTPEVQELTRSQVVATLRSVGDNKSLAGLMRKLHTMEGL